MSDLRASVFVCSFQNTYQINSKVASGRRMQEADETIFPQQERHAELVPPVAFC